MEQRKYKRCKSPHLLPVLDISSGVQLGMLVDLSFGGLLMTSTRDLQIDKVYQLQIVLPQPVGHSKTIEFSAESVWIDTTEENEVCWVGFQIINICEYDLERIGQLFDLWSLVQKDLEIEEQ